jgi:hypothetical protein
MMFPGQFLIKAYSIFKLQLYNRFEHQICISLAVYTTAILEIKYAILSNYANLTALK